MNKEIEQKALEFDAIRKSDEILSGGTSTAYLLEFASYLGERWAGKIDESEKHRAAGATSLYTIPANLIREDLS